MTGIQGSYTDFSSYAEYNPEELFIYNRPWNSVITAPQRSAAMVQMGRPIPFKTEKPQSLPREAKFPFLPKKDIYFTGTSSTVGDKYDENKLTILSVLKDKFPKIYKYIISKVGFISPIETKAGLSTNIVPSNIKFSEFFDSQTANGLTLFLPLGPISDLLNLVVRRRIDPSNFRNKREQAINGNLILLNQKGDKLYFAYSPCAPITSAASSCGGFNDNIQDMVNWREITKFYVTTNGYVYIFK